MLRRINRLCGRSRPLLPESAAFLLVEESLLFIKFLGRVDSCESVALLDWRVQIRPMVDYVVVPGVCHWVHRPQVANVGDTVFGVPVEMAANSEVTTNIPWWLHQHGSSLERPAQSV